MKELPIKGIRTLSLIDYPKKLSAIIFLGGCNFKCPFCHNMDLVINSNKMETLDEEFILEELKRRKKMLDAVVLTGGEPTLYQNIIPFALKIKKMGYLLKLDTNGYNPDVIKKSIDEKIFNLISMDIKSSLTKERYSKASGIEININDIKKSINLLLSSNIDYEFRTTIIDGFVDKNDIINIGNYIKKTKIYYLQAANENWDNFNGPNEKTIKEIAKDLQNMGINTYFR